jgi:hypothetical protein
MAFALRSNVSRQNDVVQTNGAMGAD